MQFGDKTSKAGKRARHAMKAIKARQKKIRIVKKHPGNNRFGMVFLPLPTIGGVGILVQLLEAIIKNLMSGGRYSKVCVRKTRVPNISLELVFAKEMLYTGPRPVSYSTFY
jgi:hypothetical protein